MDKTANKVLSLVIERVKKYGPPAAIVGGGLAGLNHVVAMSNKKKEEEKKNDSGVIYLEIPKSASMFDTPAGSQYLLDSGLVAGSVLGGGAIGYKVVDSILKGIRKKKYEQELDRTKREYAGLLSQKIYGLEGGNKTASDVQYKNIEGLAFSVYESMKEQGLDKQAMDKEAISDPTLGSLFMSLPGLGALVSGMLAHNYWYGRQKDIERGVAKQDADSIKRTPAVIKIKTVNPMDEEGREQKEGGVLGSSPLDSVATVESLVSLAERSKDREGDEPESRKQREKGAPIFREEDIQPVDHNTVIVNTDEGDTQLEAVDPEAVALLEKYKDIIAKSIAVGANMNNSPKDS